MRYIADNLCGIDVTVACGFSKPDASGQHRHTAPSLPPATAMLLQNSIDAA
jgi:hypothetical protein